MTHIVLPSSANIDEWAIRYFIKSLQDQNLASQLNGHFDVNTKFHDLLEKAVRIVESRKTETKYSTDNYSANNRTVGARNFDRRQRQDSHNSDSYNRNQSNGTNDDND